VAIKAVVGDSVGGLVGAMGAEGLLTGLDEGLGGAGTVVG